MRYLDIDTIISRMIAVMPANTSNEVIVSVTPLDGLSMQWEWKAEGTTYHYGIGIRTPELNRLLDVTGWIDILIDHALVEMAR